MAACAQEACFGFSPTDDLEQRLSQHRVSPLRLEVLEQPGGSLNCDYARLAEARFGHFARQLFRPMQVRGREVRPIRVTAMLAVGEVLPHSWGIAFIREEVAYQAIKSGGKARDCRREYEPVGS
jgi:hypothetical protein